MNKQRQKNQPETAGIFSKYLSIIVPVVLMLLLIVGLALFNYFSSIEQNRSTTMINLAARQAELSQSIAKDVMSLHLFVVTPQDGYSENTLEESLTLTDRKLVSSVKTFDRTLNAFLNGGEVTNVDGSTAVINPVDIPDAVYALQNGQRMWVPFRQLIESFIGSVRDGRADEEAISFASDYARLFEGRLFNEMKDLNNQLSAKTDRDTSVAQIVNGVGLLAAFILFFYIVLIALRRLLRSDAELARARKETTEIMETIQEGLFLMDADLHIGTQQSGELAEILPIKNITGKTLDEVISNFVNEADLSNTRRFVNQLFNKRVKEKLLDDLNPLRQVRVVFNDENGRFFTRYLRFKFNRVYQNKQIVRVLVTVSDITESVNLQKLLEQERRQNQIQTEMLIKVLHLDQNLLTGFVRRTTEITRRVNEILKKGNNEQPQLRKKLNDIFREVHSFKGEASALEFDSFVAIAEEAEAKLKQLREKNRLTGNDFIGVAIILERLITLNEEIAGIQTKLSTFSQQQDLSCATSEPLLTQNMAHFAERIAARQHKEVEVRTTGFEQALSLPQKTEDSLREIMTQLLRNAIVHGIESPEQREAKGKPRCGHITLGFEQHNGRAELSVMDDGGGINFAALRDKLRHNPQYADKNVDNLDKKTLYRALFLPGLSTANEGSEDAGRGEGMSIVRDRIKQLPGGKIAIHSIPDSLTRFVVSFEQEK